MIIALLLPNLTRLGIWIDFKINQDFIAQVLCINKDRPMSSCNGRCYLSEQLKKVEEEKKQTSSSEKEKLKLVYCYFKVSFDLSFHTPYFIKKLNPVGVDEFYLYSFITTIFRPPKSLI